MSRRSTMVPYNNNDQGQQEDSDGPVEPKLLVTMLSVLFVAIIFLLCLRSHLQSGMEEQEDDVDDDRRRRQGYLPSSNNQSGYIFPQLPSLPPRRNEAEGADRAPSTVATDVEVAPAPVQAVSAQLVCMYRRADGWLEGSCGVCLADLADGEAVRVLPACMHYFHAACVGEWLRAHHTCPLCRAPVNSAGGAMC